ncbi:hypothetical protein ACXIZN_36240 [Amycolatopsis sp. TRM77291]
MTDTVPSSLPVLNDLSAREQELIQSARNGVELVCSKLGGHTLAMSTATEHHIRARVVRDMLLGLHGPLDPLGIRARGARILGQLDLSYVDTTTGLALVGCSFDEPITARGAHLPRFDLTSSRINPLNAQGLRVDGDLTLTNVQLTGAQATVCLYDAHIGGKFDCNRLRADYSDRPVLNANRLRVDGDMSMQDARLSSSSDSGAIRLNRGHIGSRLRAERMHCDNSTGPALTAEDLRIDGDLLLDDARFTGSGERSAVRLLGAHIGGQLGAERMHCDNSTGPALTADGLRVDLDVFLDDARFTGSGARGAVRLHSAHIGRVLSARGMHSENSTGRALHASRLQVDAYLEMDETRFTGSGEQAAVWLHAARIGGELGATRMHVVNSSGPAFYADDLQVGGSMWLEDSWLTGSARHGGVLLHSARVGGQLSFVGTRIFSGAAEGVDLEGAKVAGAVILPAELVCLQPWGRSCPCSRRISLDGFTFDALISIDWHEWLHLIRFHTASYSPSSYQQLAAIERAAGHDGNARRILIAQQQDLHRLAPEGLGGWLPRSVHQLWGILAGYGYRARRTAAALLLALAAAVGLGLWAGHVETSPGYAAERTVGSGTPGQQCTPVELIGLGLDRGLPFAPTGLRARCDLDTTTTSGQVFTVAVWIVQAAVWGLATLALAGYTGLIRKPA